MSAITTIAIIAEAGINSNILILLVCEANATVLTGAEDLASFSHYTFGKLTLTTIMILSFFHVKIIPKPYVMYNYQLLSILFSIT